MWVGLVALGLATVPVAARIVPLWVPPEEAVRLTQAEARTLLADRLDVAVVLALGTACYIALRVLRARATEQYVRRALRQGSYSLSRSPAFPYTLGICAVGLILGSVALAYLALFTAGGDDTETLRGILERDHPGLLLLSALAVPVAALIFAWRHRSRREVPRLEQAGLVRVGAAPPQTQEGAIRLRLRAYLWGVVVETLFFAFALLAMVLPGGEEPTGDDLVFQGSLVIVGPGMVSFILLVLLLVLPGTHWLGRACLRRPVALWAVLMMVAGALLNPEGPHLLAAVGGEGVERYDTLIAVASVGLALAGVTMASLTSLYLMDIAAQPWLGLLYLGFAYFLGYFTTTSGQATLPSSVAAWIGALVALGYVLWEGRKHWHEHIGVRAATPAP
jgi:hypothetical protein